MLAQDRNNKQNIQKFLGIDSMLKSDIVNATIALNIQDKIYPFKQYISQDMSYRYLGLQDVDQNINNITSTTNNCIVYTIVLDGLRPFIVFLLEKKNNILTFPSIQTTKNTSPTLPSDINKQYGEYSYKGLKDFNNNQYLLFSTDSNNIETPILVENNNKYQWVSMYDILNNKKNFLTDISNQVVDFFEKNIDFTYLVDNMNILIEHPITSYIGDYYTKINIMSILGLLRSEPYNSFGGYYYSNDIDKAKHNSIETINKKPIVVHDKNITYKDTSIYTKGGILKLISFIKTTKVVLNQQNDKSDISELSLQLEQEKLYDKKTRKIRDISGDWTRNYDSVIVPRIKIDNHVMDPLFVFKYNKQIFPFQYSYMLTDKVIETKKNNIQQGYIQ